MLWLAKPANRKIYGCSTKLLLQVACGVGKLGENDDLLLLEHGIGLQKLDQRLELVIPLRRHPANLAQEIRQLVEVIEGVVQDRVHIEEVGVEAKWRSLPPVVSSIIWRKSCTELFTGVAVR